MAQADMENIETDPLIQELRRESLSVSPKTRTSVEEDRVDDVIHVNHNFTNIISRLIAKMKRPIESRATRKRVTLCCQNFFMHWKSLIIVVVPVILIPLPVISGTKEAKCAYVVLLMAIYWMTEVLPLPVTSLLPIALFPLFGVLSTDEVLSKYFHEVNMMLFGGLAMAVAIEYCNLHERIALKVLLSVGTSPKLLMLGFMITTMFLSMWISNSAATAMTAPIVLAVLKEINKEDDNEILQTGQEKDLDEQLQLLQDDEEMDENKEMEDLEKGISGDEQKTQEESSMKNEDLGNADEIDRRESINKATADKITTGYFLCLSFASNIGGTGTLIGTGTNLIFAGLFKSMFPEALPINFAAWMAVAVPSMLLCTFLAWIWLQIYFLRLFRGGIDSGGPEAEKKIRILIQNKYNVLGKISQHELMVLILFSVLIVLWFFRSPQFITGWGDVISDKKVTDSTTVIFFLLLLSLLPADRKFASCKGNHEVSPPLITWAALHKKVPWGLLLLLGGGFAMAHGCTESGLSKWIGGEMTVLKSLPTFLLGLTVSFLAACLSEVTSNTSAANIFLPVLAEMVNIHGLLIQSRSIRIHPLYLMIPTTLACSYAFMLPVGTPPNAIVQAASNMSTSYMMKAGAVMTLICVIVTMVTFQLIGPLMFNLEDFPD